MTIFRFALKRSVRNATNIALLFATPLLVVFLPSQEWSALPYGYFIYGLLLLFLASRLVGIMMDDRVSGLMSRIGAAPVTHLQYLWQNLLAFSLLLAAQNAAVVIGGVLYGHELVRPVALFALFFVFSLTSVSFALAFFSLFRLKETAFSILICLVMIASMAGGLLFPIVLLPEFMQRLAMILPTYWMAEAMGMIASEVDWTELAVPSIILLLFACLFLIAGSKRPIS